MVCLFFVFFFFVGGGAGAGLIVCLLKRCSMAGMDYNIQIFW